MGSLGNYLGPGLICLGIIFVVVGILRFAVKPHGQDWRKGMIPRFSFIEIGILLAVLGCVIIGTIQ